MRMTEKSSALTTRQARNFIVLSDIAVETNVLQVLTNKVRRSVSGSGTLTRCFDVVELAHNLAETLLKKFLSRDPGVELVIEPSPFDLVLEALLELRAAHDHLWETQC
jgi:hypothetical protein